MEPVEVNAGAWYLRALRDDDRLSDVPALRLLGVDDPAGYVRRVESGWTEESQFTWAVAVPTTGELIAVIGLTPTGPGACELRGRSRDRYADALDAAVAPISRFAAGLLHLDPSPLVSGLP